MDGRVFTMAVLAVVRLISAAMANRAEIGATAGDLRGRESCAAWRQAETAWTKLARLETEVRHRAAGSGWTGRLDPELTWQRVERAGAAADTACASVEAR